MEKLQVEKIDQLNTPEASAHEMVFLGPTLGKIPFRIRNRA